MSRARIAADLALALCIDLVQKASAYVVLAILARRYAPPEMGGLFAALALATLAAAVTEAGTSRYLIREVARHPGEGLARLGAVLALRLPLAAGALAALAAALALWRPALLGVGVPAAGAVLLSDLYYAFGAFLLGHRRVGLRLATGVMGPLLAVALVALAGALGATLAGALLAWTAAAAVALAASAAVVRLRFGPVPLRGARDPIRRAAREALPFFALAALAVVHLKGDTVLLFGLASPAAVALYESGYKLLEASRLPLRPAVLVFYPLSAALAGRDPARFDRLVRGLFLAAAAAGALGSLVLFLAARPVIGAVWGERYLEAAPLARILFLAVPALYLGGVATFLAAAVGLERRAAGLLALWVAANLGLNLWAIPRFGPVGAAWTALATETGAAASLVLAVLQRLRAERSLKGARPL